MGMDPLTLMAGGSLISGVLGAGAASSAADTQAGAANRATDMQRQMFDITSGYEAPYRNIGSAAGYRLAGLLGLSPGTQGTGQGGTAETADQIRARLSSQYTRPGIPSEAMFNGENAGAGAQTGYSLGSPGTTDTAGLEAAVQAELAKQGGGGQPGMVDPNSADFGSLAKNFSMSDFQLDPGIQFQLQYGNQALQNSQAAKNGVLSGGALKDLMSFNQGLAGTGYQSAYDRYMQNKQFTYGSLKDLMNIGQSAAANTGNTGANFASGMSNTIVGAGQAGAAGTMGVANALSGGLNNAGSMYYLHSLMNQGGGLGGPITTSANPNGVYIAPNA